MRRLLCFAILLLLLAACGRDKREEPISAAPVSEATATTASVVAPTAPPTETNSDATTGANPEATTVPAAALSAPPSIEPLDAVQSAIAAQFAGGPYRVLTTVTTSDTVTEMRSEVIPPDKMYIVIGGGNLEMILIDDTLWSKSGGADWARMGSPEMMQGIFDSMQGQMNESTLSNVQYVGEEPVYGEATIVYSFTSTLGEGEAMVTSEVTLWVSKASGLPLRMEADGTGMGMTSHTVQTIEYDSTITIEAPAP